MQQVEAKGEQEIAALHDQQAQLANEKDIQEQHFQQQLKELMAEKEKCEKLLQAQIKKQEQDLVQLSSECETVRESDRRAKEETQTQRLKAEMLETELRREKDGAAELRIKLATASTNIATLEGQQQQLTADVSSFQAQIAKLTRENDAIKAEKTGLESRLADSIVAIEAAKREEGRDKELLQGLKNELTDKTQQLDALHKELSLTVQAKEQEHAALQTAIKESEQAAKNTQEQLEKATTENALLKAENGSLLDQTVQHKDVVAKLRDDHCSLLEKDKQAIIELRQMQQAVD